jgi:hypothetical protein
MGVFSCSLSAAILLPSATFRIVAERSAWNAITEYIGWWILRSKLNPDGNLDDVLSLWKNKPTEPLDLGMDETVAGVGTVGLEITRCYEPNQPGDFLWMCLVRASVSQSQDGLLHETTLFLESIDGHALRFPPNYDPAAAAFKAIQSLLVRLDIRSDGEFSRTDPGKVVKLFASIQEQLVKRTIKVPIIDWEVSSKYAGWVLSVVTIVLLIWLRDLARRAAVGEETESWLIVGVNGSLARVMQAAFVLLMMVAVSVIGLMFLLSVASTGFIVRHYWRMSGWSQDTAFLVAWGASIALVAFQHWLALMFVLRYREVASRWT